jgi:transcriptional regulator with XRE-family HTH domain
LDARIAQRFERLLDAYRRPDGRKWGGKVLQDATKGLVTKPYVTHLRKGSHREPGYEKLRTIAEAMGFPPELWFEDAR